MESVIRLLPYAEGDGVANMAADETLVRAAANGIASLRLYTWMAPTLSLGYFQTHAVRNTDSRLSQLPFVRRPSGGATLVHHHELTYALALPPGPTWQGGESWLVRMHRIVATALSDLGVACVLVDADPIKHGEVLCFQQYTRGDVLCGGKKIVGSAQRKYHQALMQHGSILLAQSEHTPALPGIRELTGRSLGIADVGRAIRAAFAQATGWSFHGSERTKQEEDWLAELSEKYASREWNERR